MLRLLEDNIGMRKRSLKFHPEVFVADKNGALDANRNEVLYVNSKNNPYIFSIFTKNNKDTSWSYNNEAWVLYKENYSALLWKYYNPKSNWKDEAIKK
jgi:beta-lactamase class A